MKLFPSQPAVILIDDDNPELLAAVESAKAGLPQFVNAFENHLRDEDRDEGDHFAIKAPISFGSRTEFMWVTTTAIENGVFYGILDNKPVDLPHLGRGDRMRISVSDVSDWIYTQGDRTFGGFSNRVITQLARAQNSLHLRGI